MKYPLFLLLLPLLAWADPEITPPAPPVPVCEQALEGLRFPTIRRIEMALNHIYGERSPKAEVNQLIQRLKASGAKKEDAIRIVAMATAKLVNMKADYPTEAAASARAVIGGANSYRELQNFLALLKTTPAGDFSPFKVFTDEARQAAAVREAQREVTSVAQRKAALFSSRMGWIKEADWVKGEALGLPEIPDISFGVPWVRADDLSVDLELSAIRYVLNRGEKPVAIGSRQMHSLWSKKERDGKRNADMLSVTYDAEGPVFHVRETKSGGRSGAVDQIVATMEAVRKHLPKARFGTLEVIYPEPKAKPNELRPQNIRVGGELTKFNIGRFPSPTAAVIWMSEIASLRSQ